MHVKLQPLIFDHLRVTGLEYAVTMLYGDDGRPIKSVKLTITKGYIYTCGQYFNYKVDGKIVFLWVIGC